MAMARAADSSQFEGKREVAIGRLSVWPSMRSTQSSSDGISALTSRSVAAAS